MDANNEVWKAFGRRLHFPRGPEERYWLELPNSFPLTGDIAANGSTGRRATAALAFRLGEAVNDCDFRDGSDPLFEQCHPHVCFSSDSDQRAHIARSVGQPSADVLVPSNGISARVLFDGVMLTFTDGLFGNQRPLTLGKCMRVGRDAVRRSAISA